MLKLQKLESQRTVRKTGRNQTRLEKMQKAKTCSSKHRTRKKKHQQKIEKT